MRRVVATLLLAGVALSGCATPDTPWPEAKTEEECRYEHRKEAARIRNASTASVNTGAPWWVGPLASGVAKGMSSSQNDRLLASCLARVNPTTSSATAQSPSGYRPMAGCTANSSVLQGGSSYCVK